MVFCPHLLNSGSEAGQFIYGLRAATRFVGFLIQGGCQHAVI